MNYEKNHLSKMFGESICLSIASIMLLASTLMIFNAWRKQESSSPRNLEKLALPNHPVFEFREGIPRQKEKNVLEFPLFTGQYD